MSNSAAVQERFRTAMALFDVAVRMMRQNLRRKHPSASEQEIEVWLQEWLKRRPRALTAEATDADLEDARRLLEQITRRGFHRGRDLTAAFDEFLASN